MLILPCEFECRQCGTRVAYSEPPDLIPACDTCGRIMRAAWERDGTPIPGVRMCTECDGTGAIAFYALRPNQPAHCPDCAGMGVIVAGNADGAE